MKVARSLANICIFFATIWLSKHCFAAIPFCLLPFILTSLLLNCHFSLSHCQQRWEDLNLKPEKSYWRGRLSTVDLLELTSLDQLLFIMEILFRCFTKHATLSWRSTVLSLPLKLVFLASTLGCWGKCSTTVPPPLA